MAPIARANQVSPTAIIRNPTRLTGHRAAATTPSAVNDQPTPNVNGKAATRSSREVS